MQIRADLTPETIQRMADALDACDTAFLVQRVPGDPEVIDHFTGEAAVRVALILDEIRADRAEGDQREPVKKGPPIPTPTEMLAEFVHVVNQCGGMSFDPELQEYTPDGASHWVALGQTYLRACQALGVKPFVTD